MCLILLRCCLGIYYLEVHLISYHPTSHRQAHSFIYPQIIPFERTVRIKVSVLGNYASTVTYYLPSSTPAHCQCTTLPITMPFTHQQTKPHIPKTISKLLFSLSPSFILPFTRLIYIVTYGTKYLSPQYIFHTHQYTRPTIPLSSSNNHLSWDSQYRIKVSNLPIQATKPLLQTNCVISLSTLSQKPKNPESLACNHHPYISFSLKNSRGGTPLILPSARVSLFMNWEKCVCTATRRAPWFGLSWGR